jgi:hypothetical protein
MSRSSRLIAVIAAVAQFVFIVSWIIAAFWQGDRYSVLAHSISDMYAVTAPNGLFLVAVFTITGLLTMVFAGVVWQTLRAGGWTAAVGAILLGLSIFGLGDLLTAFERLACRIADRGCTAESQLSNAGGQLDANLSTVGVALYIGAAIFLSFAMARIPAWRVGVWPARYVAFAMIFFFLADGVLGQAGLSGIAERLLAAVGALGIAALAIRIARGRAVVTL